MTSNHPQGRDFVSTAEPTTPENQRETPRVHVQIQAKPPVLKTGLRVDVSTGGKHRIEGQPLQVPGKPSALSTYQTALYNRALHPELFPLKARRVVSGVGYELEGWIMPGCHLLRFEQHSLCACELLSDRDTLVPAQGIVARFFCAGEHEFEHSFKKDKVTYMVSIQTESLSENLYLATYDELAEHGREVSALVYEWTDEVGKCLSMIELQRMSGEVHAHCYHLVANGGLVVRTQSIFEKTA